MNRPLPDTHRSPPQPPATPPLRIGVVQNSAGDDVLRNLARLDELVGGLGEVDLIALPEVLAFRGSDEGYREAAQPHDGPVGQHLAGLARTRQSWVLAGSLLERDGERVYNTTVLFDRGGAVHATYRKIHLFEAHLEDGRLIREADAYEPGSEPVTADVEGWTAGLAMCYDLRFPELFRLYTGRGASILFVPSNFTQRTGRDHWEILLRARAIENQSFVVAPNQCGTNPATGVTSHGHSMIVGPWGDVLAVAGDEEGVIAAMLDPAELVKIRRRVPALNHRVL